MRYIVGLIFATITIISAVQTIINQSTAVGLSALAATVLIYIAASTFVGSYLARREKKYRLSDLVGIGTIAALLMLGGFTLAYWSSFKINAGFGIVDGFTWLFLMVIVSALVVRKRDALADSYRSDDRGKAETGPMESTLQQLQAEAQRGNAQAQYALGGAYYNGNGVTRNPAQGAQWLLRAAEGGYAPAQCDLGGHVPEWGGSKSELQRRSEVVSEGR
jgi:TPR repeat protein